MDSSMAQNPVANGATAGGAAALGFGDELGEIAPGRRPGVVVLEGIDFSAMRLLPESRTTRLA